MDPEEADGENLGIVKFGATGARLLIEEMSTLVEAGEVKAWVPRAFKEFAQRRPLHAIGTRGLPWIEIDFPEDYRRAVEEVLPQIERDLCRLPPSHRCWRASRGLPEGSVCTRNTSSCASGRSR